MPRRPADTIASPGARLRAAREAAGYTQRRLAHQAKVHEQTVAKIERGLVRLTAETAAALAEVLGIPPGLLLPEMFGAPDGPRTLTLVPGPEGRGMAPLGPADAALLAEIAGSASHLMPLGALLDLARQHRVAVTFRGDLAPGEG